MFGVSGTGFRERGFRGLGFWRFWYRFSRYLFEV